jgi:6-pyruvoyltetrahydropterin/6-carboxytetrahydropterin synthase
MYEISVERAFHAIHAITIGGEAESPHGHDWTVRVVVSGTALDDDGLLLDFHELEKRIDEILAPFRGADLNDTEPFDRVNPTAEHVARHVAEALAFALPTHVRVQRVSVTESPGCVATYVV